MIKVKIFDESFNIDFPNVGQLIDIESNKLLYSNNAYSSLVLSNSKGANIALDLIDSISTFIVLIPNLKKRISKSIFELSLLEAQEIVKQYKEIYAPWFFEKLEEINKIQEEWLAKDDKEKK